MDRVVTDGHFLGIDIGTQSVRAYAVTPAGDVLAHGAVALTSRRHGVRHEQDPTQWWDATVRAVNVVTRETPDVPMRGVACCGTSGTVLFRTADGQAATPALMYDDGRARGVTFSGADGAQTAPPSWGLAKARWLLDAYDVPAGARLAHQVDVLTRQLTDESAPTDWSNALKTGADPRTGDWPADLPLPRERLPAVVAPGTRIGRVNPRAAEATGIPAGTPVVAGLTDGCAAQVAAGALGAGDWNLVFGTTFVLKGCTAERLRDPDGLFYSHRSPDGSWWPGVACAAGHGAVPVLLGASPDYPALEAAAESALGWDASRGARGAFAGERGQAYAGAGAPGVRLICDPRVAGPRLLDTASGQDRVLGDPLADPLADSEVPVPGPDDSGTPVGEERGEAVERYLAVQLGAAFLARRWLTRAYELGALGRDDASGTVGVTGGATRSVLFRRLLADVLERELVLPAHPEGAFGMSVLAASGDFGSLREAAASMVRVGQRCTPVEPGRWETAYEAWLAHFDPMARRRG